MMDTVLNLGLNDETVVGLAELSGNPRFAWDAYRRFVQMYADVVLGVKARDEGGRDPFAVALDELKSDRGVKKDTELTAEDLEELVALFKARSCASSPAARPSPRIRSSSSGARSAPCSAPGTTSAPSPTAR